MFFAWKVHWRTLGTICLSFLIVFSAAFAVFAVSVEPHQQENAIELPIIMYHSLLKDSTYHGKYVLSPLQLEADLQYLQKEGYTTVHMADVIDYVTNGTPLPERPIVLSFDDGFYNNYVYAYPLAEQYQAKMVIAPVGYYTDQYSESGEKNANYSYLTWDEIREMSKSGLIEFQNHTYNLHSSVDRKGAGRKPGETLAEYESVLMADIGSMQEKLEVCTGIRPNTMVFPFGEVSDEGVAIARKLGFQAVFTCREKINLITRDPECLYLLGRFLRPSGVDSQTYFTKYVGLS